MSGNISEKLRLLDQDLDKLKQMGDKSTGRSSQSELDKKIVEIASSLKGIFITHMSADEGYEVLTTVSSFPNEVKLFTQLVQKAKDLTGGKVSSLLNEFELGDRMYGRCNATEPYRNIFPQHQNSAKGTASIIIDPLNNAYMHDHTTDKLTGDFKTPYFAVDAGETTRFESSAADYKSFYKSIPQIAAAKNDMKRKK